MGKLQTLRDILAIVRDSLLIMFLIGLVFLIINGIIFVSKLTEELEKGGLSSLIKLGPRGMPFTPGQAKTNNACLLLQEMGSAFQSGDREEGFQKLDELISYLEQNNLTNEIQIANNLKQAIQRNDEEAIITYFTQLSISLKC